MGPPSSSALDSAALAALQRTAEAAGRQCVVSAIILDATGRAFIQRRSVHRRLFPLCWDLAGGHVDPGETLAQALAREIHEETGWNLHRLLRLVAVLDWAEEGTGGADAGARREFCFLVEVRGDLSCPRLELGKVTEFRWIAANELEILKEHRRTGDEAVFQLVAAGLRAAER